MKVGDHKWTHGECASISYEPSKPTVPPYNPALRQPSCVLCGHTWRWPDGSGSADRGTCGLGSSPSDSDCLSYIYWSCVRDESWQSLAMFNSLKRTITPSHTNMNNGVLLKMTVFFRSCLMRKAVLLCTLSSHLNVWFSGRQLDSPPAFVLNRLWMLFSWRMCGDPGLPRVCIWNDLNTLNREFWIFSFETTPKHDSIDVPTIPSHMKSEYNGMSFHNCYNFPGDTEMAWNKESSNIQKNNSNQAQLSESVEGSLTGTMWVRDCVQEHGWLLGSCVTNKPHPQHEWQLAKPINLTDVVSSALDLSATICFYTLRPWCILWVWWLYVCTGVCMCVCLKISIAVINTRTCAASAFLFCANSLVRKNTFYENSSSVKLLSHLPCHMLPMCTLSLPLPHLKQAHRQFTASFGCRCRMCLFCVSAVLHMSLWGGGGAVGIQITH